MTVNDPIKKYLHALSDAMYGQLYTDVGHLMMYATDASIYRMKPLAVAMPANTKDLKTLITFSNQHAVPLIPRAAGTSLAGQVVGNGIIVDISRHFTRILEINKDEQWVVLEPGVNRDDLNLKLAQYGLFFGPNTSTSNRCLLGGMVGNNSCGTTSIKYGTTREHVLELNVLLSNGQEVKWGALEKKEWRSKCEVQGLEGDIYRCLDKILSDGPNREIIRDGYPKAGVSRRNSGYALDALTDTVPFGGSDKINVSKLICGSEGTLCFVTSMKLHLNQVPPSKVRLITPHFESIRESLEAVKVIMEHEPYACELMDDVIIACASDHKLFATYSHFIEGSPKGVLMVECRDDDEVKLEFEVNSIIQRLKRAGLGYAYPVLRDDDVINAWKLRKGGLGLLSNLPGPERAVACIEDTAVDIKDLPEYIDDFTEMMNNHGQRAVYYAHAGAGELHLRPILDLTHRNGVAALRQISTDTADLVKSYGGSLSGEHGDGIVRSEFLQRFYGDHIYAMFVDIKSTFDPANIFNPGKIVDPWPMDENLRFESNHEGTQIDTIFDFGDQGMLGAAERCNGSGDCRKSHLQGGTMCPSYMATRNEKDTTRARANVLREVLNGRVDVNLGNPELNEVMDLCLSCKGCTAECPSNVDMAALHVEYQYQKSKTKKRPISDRIFGKYHQFMSFAHRYAPLGPMAVNSAPGQWIARQVLQVPNGRSLPKITRDTFRKWWRANSDNYAVANPRQSIYLFVDEFTEYQDVSIGVKAVELLHRFNIQVEVIDHPVSGRALISKGYLEEARFIANRQIEIFAGLVNKAKPIVGIEPSAILSFRDEYPRICKPELRDTGAELANHVFTIEEYLYDLFSNDIAIPEIKVDDVKKVFIHGHCHQKALSDIEKTAFVLGAFPGIQVEVLDTGCCGMAGSFGMTRKHFEVSQQIGNLVLFPALKRKRANDLVVASGTSCRHQILDACQTVALHPVELLHRLVIPS